jgi:elongation factor Ts
MDAAIDWLRTKGLATAAKKSGRVAAEGLIAIAVSGTIGAVVELNAETDFVARNTEFQEFASTLANIALEVVDLDALNGADFPGTGRIVSEELTQKIATIGEKMSLRRMHKIEVSSGVVVPYMHNATADGLGPYWCIGRLAVRGRCQQLVRSWQAAGDAYRRDITCQPVCR